MKWIVLIAYLPVIIPNAGAVQFGDPPAIVTVNAGSSFGLKMLSDITDASTEPFKTATVTVDCDTNKFAPPVGSTTLVGCNVQAAVKIATGYSVTFVAGSDAILTGECFKLTFKAPVAAGTYTFKISSLSMLNSAGTSVNVSTPIASPDTLVVKTTPWKWVARLFGA